MVVDSSRRNFFRNIVSTSSRPKATETVDSSTETGEVRHRGISRRDAIAKGLLGIVGANIIGGELAKAGETNDAKTADIAPTTTTKTPEQKTVEQIVEKLIEERFIPNDDLVKSTIKDRLEVLQQDQTTRPESFLKGLLWMRKSGLFKGNEDKVSYFVFNRDLTESLKTMSGLLEEVKRITQWYIDKKSVTDRKQAEEKAYDYVRKHGVHVVVKKFLEEGYSPPKNIAANNLLNFYTKL